jgi:hypothetical protein
MAIHFYPKVGGHVDFDTPEEAARFFEITGGGTIEAPQSENLATSIETTASIASKTPVATAVPKTRKRKNPLNKNLEESLQIVMGSQELTAPQLHQKLSERGWLPDNSKDPLNYIRYTLSKNKTIFKSRSRGKYHLDPSNSYAISDQTVAVMEVSEKIDTIDPPEVIKTASSDSKTEDTDTLATPVTVTENPPLVETPVTVTENPPLVETPVAVTENPPLVETPVTVIERPVVVKETKPPVRTTVANPPEIDGSRDPVEDILAEFANELGSLV